MPLCIAAHAECHLKWVLAGHDCDGEDLILTWVSQFAGVEIVPVFQKLSFPPVSRPILLQGFLTLSALFVCVVSTDRARHGLTVPVGNPHAALATPLY